MAGPTPVHFLTTYDVQQEGEVHFSGCLIYDLESEEEAVRRFVDTMRRINEYLIFFDPYKDMLWGRYEMDALSQVIHERCGGRALIFIPKTGKFTDANMNFALQYTRQLDPNCQERCLIPIRCYENVSYPRILQGIHKIDMYTNAYLQDYWVQQSKQFRRSFSTNGPLRRECIQFNRGYNRHIDEHQDVQASCLDDQTDLNFAYGTTAYSPNRNINSKPEEEYPQISGTGEDLTSNRSSISFQNTSLDSSQGSCKDAKPSFAGNPIETSKRAERTVSDKETDNRLHSKNTKESEPNDKKGKMKKRLKNLVSFFKARN